MLFFDTHLETVKFCEMYKFEMMDITIRATGPVGQKQFSKGFINYCIADSHLGNTAQKVQVSISGFGPAQCLLKKGFTLVTIWI